MRSIVLIACILITSLVHAQTSPVLNVGDVESVIITNQQIQLTTTNAFGEITVYSPTIVRIRLDKKPLLKDFSYAVIGKPVDTKVSITEDANQIVIVTDSLKAIFQKKPFATNFYTRNGQIILQDEPGLTTAWVGEEVTTYKKINNEERFIGLGEKTGNLNRAGAGYTNWNADVPGYSTDADPLYSTIPFYIGIHDKVNYGIFLDNTFQSDFNFGASNDRFSSFGARGGEMNYYFIYHTKLADIITSYTSLTGKMELPPLWSLGYQQNRYSYYPETEVMRIAQTLREKKIPCDGITLDIHYMDDYQLFTWNKTRFPDPVSMSSTLAKMGFRLTVIVDPGIKIQKGAAAYESGVQDSIFIKYPDGKFYAGQVWPGWCNFPDFTSDKGRTWWHSQVKFFAVSGVSGIWNDMNEIATWGQKMPSNVLFNYDNKQASHLQAHNVYGMQMARASYEGAKIHFKERPFILTRAGYAGLQRYAAIWTGDNRSEDNHMLLGVRMMNSLGVSGVPFTGMDIGGFIGSPGSASYIRWMQVGAFIPYFRNHTSYNTKASEPWTYGEDALENVRKHINLRYKLLPYIYSAFYEATQRGLPLMRTLAINHTFDTNVYDGKYQNQYMFGDAFLVTPFESNKEYGKVYLPQGTWYDLYSDARSSGGQSYIIPLSNNKLQVYVKESSIIPMQSLTQSTAEKPSDVLTIHIYNGQHVNSFNYYEDDGKSYEYKTHNFYQRVIRLDPKNKQLSFSKVAGNYKTNFKQFKLVLHGFENLKALKLDGKLKELKSEHVSFLLDELAAVNDRRDDGSDVKTVLIENGSDEMIASY